MLVAVAVVAHTDTSCHDGADVGSAVLEAMGPAVVDL